MSVVMRQDMDSHDACQGRDDIDDSDNTSPLTGQPALDVHGRKDGEEDNEPIRDLKECSDEAGIPESLDNQRSKVAHGSVNDLCREAKEKEEPGLRVKEGFDELISFEVGVLDSSLIAAKSFYSQSRLIGGEPATVS
jgi:hypothetical protein